jgi:hypothetical protein
MNSPSWIVGLIGIVGVWIAFCQWRIAQNKLKLDLFERRYAAYEEFNKIIEVVRSSIENENQEWAKSDEIKIYHLALIFFNDEIGLLLSTITTRFEIAIWTLRREIANEKRTEAKQKLLLQIDNVRFEISQKVVSFLRINHQVFPWSPAYLWERAKFQIETNETLQFYIDKALRRNKP